MSEYKIYPAIGIARVGNSSTDFYVGPEVYRGLPTDLHGQPITKEQLRDRDHKMARQAARFRIFKGEQEITLDSSDIDKIVWTVHLANKKASWYDFRTNEGEQGYAPNHPLRNSGVTGSDRLKLIVDAGPRSISGKNVSGDAYQFDAASAPKHYRGVNFPKGKLYPTNEKITTLGELRTDAQGRLLVLGGFGISGTDDQSGQYSQLPEYANNDGWWDDTSDGPVAAEIHLKNGQVIPAERARVMVAPPAYAPQIPNLVTLWDTIFDAGVRDGHVPAILNNELWNKGPQGYKPSFETEIRPLIERADLYTWVTAIPPKPHKFDMDKLGQVPTSPTDDPNRGLRQWIFTVLRPPYEENTLISTNGLTSVTNGVISTSSGDNTLATMQGRTMMPYLAGDNCLIEGTLNSNYLRLTDTQYFFLSQWANGWFVAEPSAPVKGGEAITRGVLENCVGGAFSPGIEMGWISRNPAIYQQDDPFRINDAMVEHGPLSLGFNPAQMEPGDVSRYMAMPWQADFNECSSQTIGDRILWWWPSQRPEFVHVQETDGSRPNPIAWIGTDYDQEANNYISFADNVDMVRYWSQLGFVLEEPPESGKYYQVSRTLPYPEP